MTEKGQSLHHINLTLFVVQTCADGPVPVRASDGNVNITALPIDNVSCSELLVSSFRLGAVMAHG